MPGKYLPYESPNTTSVDTKRVQVFLLRPIFGSVMVSYMFML